MRVRLTQNKLPPDRHKTHFLSQSHNKHTSIASFAIQTSTHQINSALASHRTNTFNSLLHIESQIQQFETKNTKKAPLAYKNQLQFDELGHFYLSITNEPQIPFLISTKFSNTLNTSRAQLINKEKSLFCQIQSEILSV